MNPAGILPTVVQLVQECSSLQDKVLRAEPPHAVPAVQAGEAVAGDALAGVEPVGFSHCCSGRPARPACHHRGSLEAQGHGVEHGASTWPDR